MNKHLMISLAVALTAITTQAQKANFSGTWSEPELEMISGKQYSNAVPKEITVTQTKDSIKIERTEIDDSKITETIALNGKTTSRMGRTSKRTIRTTATLTNNGNTLTLVTIFSYADKPDEAEYKNTEVWELSADGMLIIEKTSDATVTDDWTIKAIYNKQ
ncbi:MAG: hypothetical protein ABI675_14295 [Chitinophagaceae bacterium]